MKVKKEIFVEICDFCAEPKSGVCSICGADICNIHKLYLNNNHVREMFYSFYGDEIVSCFCPTHLSSELAIIFSKHVEKISSKEKQ